MATYVRNARKYWKRCLFGAGVFYFVSRYAIKRYRNTVITRHICSEICGRAKERHPATENVKKAYVFLNPTADNGNARGNFEKFALPILNLAEFEVIMIESEYSGQIRTLMGYVDPKTDIVVAAGGDGTLFEMINGLMRRYDVEKFMHSVKFGIIPLGKENKFFKQCFPDQARKLPARVIGEATRTIVEGNSHPKSVMQLRSSEGNKIYALQQASWGVFKDAYNKKDRFWLFGSLRTLASHIYTAFKAWPQDYQLRLQALQQKDVQERSWNVLGFDMQLNSEGNNFLFNVWPANTTKMDFIQHGWHAGQGTISKCQPTIVIMQNCFIQPISHKETWLSIDGEAYEAMPVEATVLPNCLQMITR